MSELVVITGASGGIGGEVARQFAGAGYDVVAQYLTGAEKVSVLVEQIERLGQRCFAVQADLSEAAGIERICSAVDSILATTGVAGLDVLVNNAAKMLGPSFFDASFDSFDEYFAINTRAPFFLSQGLIKYMGRGSSIVNVSSASAHFSSPGDIVYAMTKAALESLTFNLAEAIADRGIRVNSVMPGFTDNGHRAFRSEEIRSYMSSFAVLGDVASPETVAAAVMFLASPAAARSTGTILDVSGGSALGARGARASSVKHLL